MSTPLRHHAAASTDAYRFGYQTFGPILAEYARRLWLYQRYLAPGDDATLLFCARGGLRLQTLYERFLDRTGLPRLVATRSLMVSRLVAARTAMFNPCPALFDELAREFRGEHMSAVASVLSQKRDIALGPAWDLPFEPDAFAAMLAGSRPVVADLRDAIRLQDSLFRQHLAEQTEGRATAILCDTGLFGSTVRLLQVGVPDKRWLCLMFARCNYKGFGTPHFNVTRGVCVESDLYVPWDNTTAALRFWHLIEAVLEPDLQSVRVFTDQGDGANPRSNLEVEGWHDRIVPTTPDMFSGALSYVDDLDGKALVNVPLEAGRAWKLLKQAIIWPDAKHVALFALPARSRDFGRDETVAAFGTGEDAARNLAGVRRSLWKEGALMHAFPGFGRIGLLAIEAAYTGRAVFSASRALLHRIGSVGMRRYGGS